MRTKPHHRATVVFALLAASLFAAARADAQTPAAPATGLAPGEAPAFVASKGIDPDELPVKVINKSGPELCAEKDNVELDFVSPQVRSLRIQAEHPAYIGTIAVDRWAPDITACDMTHDESVASPSGTRRVTFWETPEFWLTGYTFPSFWRKNDVPFRVGDHVENGLDLVQLWMWYRERAEEILVVYPPDGYWRARPLPFADMRWSAYGSSFLLGPTDFDQRPYVALKDISFDPATKTFTLDFKQGGSATLHLAAIDQDRIALDATLSGPMPGNKPFATLRSMYTTETNADVARLAWRTKGGQGWGESPIMPFAGADVTELWAGRVLPSQHNLSAPDMDFGEFKGTP